MKKLRLELAELEVSSFAAENAGGGVNSMEMAVTQLYGCGHTAEAGCYPSKYCTGTGCVQTADYTCMTASNSPC